MAGSLYEFLNGPRGLWIVDIRVEPSTPRVCVVCGHRADGHPTVQALLFGHEGIAVVCEHCAVEVVQ